MLRPFRAEDGPAIAALRADQALQHLLMANPGALPHEQPLQEAIAWVRRREAAGFFRIIASEVDAAVGFGQISDIHRKNRFGYLGISLLPAARGQGIGRAAMAALEAAARDELGLRKLLLQVRSDNTPALKLYDAVGWRRAGLLSSQYDDGERVHDVILLERMLAHR